MVGGPGGAHAGRQGRGLQPRRRGRPCPQLVHDLPARPVDGRVPVRQRLGCRGQVSAPNADGWREILQRQETQPTAALTEKQLSQARKIPAELHDRCFNCLSYSQRVATCWLPWRCLRCHGYRHLARECKWLRRAATTMSEARGGGSRPSLYAPHGGSDRAAQVAMGHQRLPSLTLAAPEQATEGDQHCRD